MAKQPTVLGGIAYPTKGEAVAAVRSILHTAPREVDLQGVDLAIITDLLHRHPDAELKIGAGIKSISVRTVDGAYGAPCFWIERVDGTFGHFSYRNCFNAPSVKVDVSKILRNAVRFQIFDFKADAFAETPLRNQAGERVVPCALTGIHVTVAQCHADHIYPFTRLVDDWLAVEGITFEEIPLQYTDQPHIGRVISDQGLYDRWVEYHQEHAVLRIVHSDANSQRGAGTQ